MGNNFSVESRPFLQLLCGKRKYLYNMEENLEALHNVMQELNAMRYDLLKRVSKEEDIGLQGLQEVEGWISMVEEIEPKANHLLDESVSEIQRLSRYGYCSLIPASTYRYGEKVLMTLKRVQTLISKGVFEVVVHRALPPLVVKMPPIQLTVSQQNLFEKACSFLEEKNVGTLGIYGMGGVGKTTLLTKIKNKFQEAFVGLVIFVVVGSEEVESIQEEISNRLDLQWGRETKEEKAAGIFMALKGKRFLLLLDGIQREVDLKEIGVPFPSRENGCKVVFTTRSREACDESKGVDAKIEIACLSPEEAWDLFQETVGENTLRSHQDIPKLARVVASTCRGLPLALNLIGETMSRKRTVREWRYTIHVLASSTAEFPDMEDGHLPILKSIYDNMSENIRLCFLYCAPFPENCDIRKEDLVNYWIGEGILAKEDRERTEIQGYEIICDLVRMRLLMKGGNGYCVKMHGMVREMALWIASEKIPQFRNIRTVTIHGCECLRELTWLLLAPSIHDLSLSECPLVEEVISKEKAMAKLGHTSEVPFQNLTKLVLNGLPKLKSIYWAPLPFPVLEYLEIRRCPELKRLPFNSESAIGNQVEMKIEEQWIKVVEWEDEATKQRFSHFNNRDFPQMAEDPKMDGLTSESHPIQNIDLVGTTEEEEEAANERDLCWSYHSSKTGLNRHASMNNYNYGTEFSSSSMTTTGWTTNSVGRQSHFLEGASESSGRIMNEPGQILEPPNLKVFSFLDLKMAARNFEPESVLNEGFFFGKDYKGWIDAKTLAPSRPGSGMPIAIKRLSSEGAQELEYWQSQVNYFGMLSHPNLVKLLGYCREDKEILLVYEFMPRGSLGDELFRRNEPFPWDLRIKIVLGAARGLAFLHGLQRKVIYRNFKSSKILLDSNYEAKISYSILAKLGPSEENSHITTRRIGTYGYAAPEYLARGHLYVKSDVYAFGVVLLEVMTRLSAHDPNRPRGQEILVDWLRPKLSSKHVVLQIMDKGIKGEYTSKVATKMRRIILSCTEPDPRQRPHMQKVVDVLEHIQRINIVRS